MVWQVWITSAVWLWRWVISHETPFYFGKRGTGSLGMVSDRAVMAVPIKVTTLITTECGCAAGVSGWPSYWHLYSLWRMNAVGFHKNFCLFYRVIYSYPRLTLKASFKWCLVLFGFQPPTLWSSSESKLWSAGLTSVSSSTSQLSARFSCDSFIPSKIAPD